MIYFLEDDDNIRELVVYTLGAAGLSAEGFARPSAFWSAVTKKKPSLVLLDIMLPEEDGLSVLKRLRADPSTARLPIMMVTAKSSEYDTVVGLDQGADDYVTKPFGMMELVSRIKALLRRTDEEKDEFCVGDLYVRPAGGEVRVSGETVTLTHKEFDLLCLLLKHRGDVLDRDLLLRQVWGYDYTGESRTVDVHVRTLRSKLGVCGDCIETVRGRGYKIGGDA